jgi:hypothetical protein
VVSTGSLAVDPRAVDSEPVVAGAVAFDDTAGAEIGDVTPSLLHAAANAIANSTVTKHRIRYLYTCVWVYEATWSYWRKGPNDTSRTGRDACHRFVTSGQ